MDKQFSLKIVTPDREFFAGEVQSLIIQTPTGAMGILYHTLPLVAVLSSGILRICRKGRWMEAVNTDGIVTVMRDGVTVLTQSCEWPHEADDETYGRSDGLSDEERRLKSQYEYKSAKAKMTAQFAKLQRKKGDN